MEHIKFNRYILSGLLSLGLAIALIPSSVFAATSVEQLKNELAKPQVSIQSDVYQTTVGANGSFVTK